MKMRADVGVALLALGVVAGAGRASVIDLTADPSSGTVNGVLFETADFRPAGTGFITPFVRISAHGEEQGYNTSGRPVAFDELTDPNFTRNLRLNEIRIVSVLGADYYEFRLDINESNGGDKSLLSLDQVQIYTSPIGGQTTSNVSSLGALRYDLDAGGDNWIKLDYDLNSGSGQGDMAMFVPVSKFAAAAPNDFVYLYSQFGTNYQADAGFEEWSVGAVPAPGSLALVSAGVVLLVRRRRETA